MPESKAKFIRMEGSKMLVSFEQEFDPNKDGEPLGGISINLWIDIKELPDEAFDAWKSRKD